MKVKVCFQKAEIEWVKWIALGKKEIELKSKDLKKSENESMSCKSIDAMSKEMNDAWKKRYSSRVEIILI